MATNNLINQTSWGTPLIIKKSLESNHILELRNAIDNLANYTSGVTNCGFTNFCQTCQTTTCQSTGCQTTTCQSSSCQTTTCQTCQVCQSCQTYSTGCQVQCVQCNCDCGGGQ